ncbi:MAG TPA: thioredoxin TrxC [Gammaproteobacteria bacterium]|nr:thioredoxin TrxC [Gammaproteobacteria bacterium]HEV2333578.1 thioredoxin TrxC [Gammaproteobacteria bacterium]
MPDSTHIACPACGASNRVPTEKLAQQPKCGKCGEALFAGHPVEINDANFAALVSGTDLPVVVDCWATWCGPCQRFAPIFSEAAEKLEPRFRLAKLDTDANQQTAARLGIRSIPTLILFKGGKETARISGAMPLGPFMEWVKQHA